MARVVVDANIIVSSAFGGIPLRALVKAFQNTVIISPLVRQELLSLPDELAFKLTPDRILRLKRWLKLLLYHAECSTPDKTVSICRDPKDNAYLSLCLAARTDYLITGDLDLLSISRKDLSQTGLDDLSIVTPRKFLEVMT